MVRRKFVFTLIGFMVPVALSRAFRVGTFSNSGRLHVCRIDIKFPANGTAEQFDRDRTAWMNVGDFETLVKDLQQRGALVKEETAFRASGMQVSYYFSDVASHDQFVRVISARNTVSDAKLASIGYEFRRQHFQV